MPTCKKCQSPFPYRILIGGRERILSSRKYCLECSPFGTHNRRKLHLAVIRNGKRVCVSCGKEHGKNRPTCSSCQIARHRRRVRDAIHKIVGDYCWICNYGGPDKVSILDFHHMDRSKKTFSLSTANTARYSWRTVLKEVQKCIVLCCRCHREFEHGLIPQDNIDGVYEKEWTKLRRSKLK